MKNKKQEIRTLVAFDREKGLKLVCHYPRCYVLLERRGSNAWAGYKTWPMKEEREAFAHFDELSGP